MWRTYIIVLLMVYFGLGDTLDGDGEADLSATARI